MSHIQLKYIKITDILPFRESDICFTGDGSLNTEASKTETGLGCSGVIVASSANPSSSLNRRVDF